VQGFFAAFPALELIPTQFHALLPQVCLALRACFPHGKVPFFFDVSPTLVATFGIVTPRYRVMRVAPIQELIRFFPFTRASSFLHFNLCLRVRFAPPSPISLRSSLRAVSDFSVLFSRASTFFPRFYERDLSKF